MTFHWWLVFLNKRIPPNVHGHFELFFTGDEKITLVEGLAVMNVHENHSFTSRQAGSFLRRAARYGGGWCVGVAG
jgi:hypothetical protein